MKLVELVQLNRVSGYPVGDDDPTVCYHQTCRIDVQREQVEVVDQVFSVFTKGDIIANRYRVVRQLGQGGMGQVFEVLDLELDTKIALKTVTTKFLKGDTAALKQETYLARKVTHENVCRIFDLGRHFFDERTAQLCNMENVIFLTMELLTGIPLSEVFKQKEEMEFDDVMVLFRQICLGLNAAHKAGVVHSDLKGQNILLTLDKGHLRSVITDFGLAKVCHITTENITKSGGPLVEGTPAFMAPEQIEGGPITTQTDVYALGILLFQCLTGRLPFEGRNLFEAVFKRLNQEAPDPKSFNPLIPEYLSCLVQKCLARRPEDRFADAGAMLDFLEREGATAPEAPAQWPRWTVPIGIISVLALLVFGWPERNQPPPVTVHQPAEIVREPPALPFYREAVRQWMMGDLAKAFAAIEKALVVEPENPDYVFIKAKLEGLIDQGAGDAGMTLVESNLVQDADVKAMPKPPRTLQPPVDRVSPALLPLDRSPETNQPVSGREQPVVGGLEDARSSAQLLQHISDLEKNERFEDCFFLSQKLLVLNQTDPVRYPLSSDQYTWELFRIGRYYYQSGNYRAAKGQFLQVLEASASPQLLKRARRSIAAADFSSADVLIRNGALAEARPYLEASLSHVQEIQDFAFQNRIAEAFLTLAGQENASPSSVVHDLQAAYSVLSNIQPQSIELGLLNQTGNLYLSMDKSSEAAEVFGFLKDLAETRDEKFLAIAQFNLGHLNGSYKELATAKAVCRKNGFNRLESYCEIAILGLRIEEEVDQVMSQLRLDTNLYTQQDRNFSWLAKSEKFGPLYVGLKREIGKLHELEDRSYIYFYAHALRARLEGSQVQMQNVIEMSREHLGKGRFSRIEKMAVRYLEELKPFTGR